MFDKSNPLWLPAGSVRSVLALGLTGATIFGFVAGLIGAEAFTALAGAAIAFYFKDRESSSDASK